MPDVANTIVWYYAAGVLPFALLGGWLCGRAMRDQLRTKPMTAEARRRAVWGFASSGLVWLPVAFVLGATFGPVFLAAAACIFLPSLVVLSGSPTTAPAD